ncbi:MAG: fumarylacetoacetate hydrolase family protein [Gemmatimonadaceae bacterium]|nr:fumarylacetoacetate hydrolase family protein [Gemmatimonadaceae bacterium]
MRFVAFRSPLTQRVHVGALAEGRVTDLTVIGVPSMADALARAAELSRVASHLRRALGAVAHPVVDVTLEAPVHLTRPVRVYEFPEGEADRVQLSGYDAAPETVLGPSAALGAPGAGAALIAAPAVAAVLTRGGTAWSDAEGEAAIGGFVACTRWARLQGDTHAPEIVTVGLSFGPWILTPDEIEALRHDDGTYDLTLTASRDGEDFAAARWRDLPAGLGRLAALTARDRGVDAGDLIVAVLPRLPAPAAVSRTWVAAGDTVHIRAEQLGALRHHVLS